MAISVCSNCKKEFNQKSYHKESKNHFCCKQCEAEFRKGKLNRPKKVNNIVLQENYAIIKIKNNLYGNFDCLIDTEDVEKIKNFYWNIRYDKRHPKCIPYVESHPMGKRLHLHRFIMNCPNNMVVDHINGNNLDNRKENLRICTQQINTCNRKSYRELPLGIYIDTRKKNKKYTVYFQGQYLKSFTNINDAQIYRENYVNGYMLDPNRKNAGINQLPLP